MTQSVTISSWLLPPMWPGFESQRTLYSYSELNVLRVRFIARPRGISYWYSRFPLWTKNTAHYKEIQDSLGFWIPRRGFRIPRYWIPVFFGRTWILDSLSVFRIPQVKISQIPQSGFLYTGRKSNSSNSNSIWKVSQVIWKPGLWNFQGVNGSINNVS